MLWNMNHRKFASNYLVRSSFFMTRKSQFGAISQLISSLVHILLRKYKITEAVKVTGIVARHLQTLIIDCEIILFQNENTIKT